MAGSAASLRPLRSTSRGAGRRHRGARSLAASGQRQAQLIDTVGMWTAVVAVLAELFSSGLAVAVDPRDCGSALPAV